MTAAAFKRERERMVNKIVPSSVYTRLLSALCKQHRMILC